MKKFTRWEKIKLALGQSIYIGDIQKPGWSGKLPFYVLWCDVHGIVENYPHGNGGLRCPDCIEDT